MCIVGMILTGDGRNIGRKDCQGTLLSTHRLNRNKTRVFGGLKYAVLPVIKVAELWHGFEINSLLLRILSFFNFIPVLELISAFT